MGWLGKALKGSLLVVLLAWLGMAIWQSVKPLPSDVGKAWPMRSVERVSLLADRTWYDRRGQQQLDQQIFDEAVSMIGEARRLIVMDMFLFNRLEGQAGARSARFRPIAERLTDALIAARQRDPAPRIVVITDPLNTLYGGQQVALYQRLEDAGVELVMTRLDRLRASNPLWSGLWHLGLHRLGNDSEGGWLPNAFGGEPVTLRSYLALLNFRANHRKTLTVDTPRGWSTLISTANPHDASSLHSNVALRIDGALAGDVIASEAEVASWSGVEVVLPDSRETGPGNADRRQSSGAEARLLTEGAIRDAVLARIEEASPGDRLDLAAFYLAHREVIAGLKRAASRGATVRVLLDPNREAFGFSKGGLPNQPVAEELLASGVQVRWCLTSGEQCHSKVVLLRKEATADPSARDAVILGSANLTRRNLDNLNLESSVEVTGRELPVIDALGQWFDLRWESPPHHRASRAWSERDASGRLAAWRYRVMEATGLSTF
ncbi:phospholipase D-like domain-containing protein [Halomonas cupida]|uniref:phospholipase D-like domain-containing protein n=1 Tax=Halomonas TaxID=2745 RepID=UPI001C972C00|nr:phospholipase D-like domain-containing protein [Halomonas sp. DP8Y7-3]MBY5931001.1 phospholipase [Halomonas sp. DP8Y7-3]